MSPCGIHSRWKIERNSLRTHEVFSKMVVYGLNAASHADSSVQKLELVAVLKASEKVYGNSHIPVQEST